MSQETLERIQSRLAECDSAVSALEEHAAQQTAIMKEDIHTFSKFFFSSADLATQYLKDQLGGTIKQLASKITVANERFREAQVAGDKSLLAESDREVVSLLAEITAKSKEKKQYRQSARTRDLYQELEDIFHKFTKDMFRKFKRFIHSGEETEPREDFKALTELIQQRERMNEVFGKIIPAAEIKLTYRDLPENLPRLPAFPKITTEVYTEVMNRYGPFAMKEISNPAFVNLKTLPPVQLEDGSVYEGQWSGHLRVGKGKALFRSGDSYEGYWLDDKPDLLGRMVSCDGDVYEVLCCH